MCGCILPVHFSTKCMRDVIENSIVRFLLALLIGVVVAAIFGVIIGIPVLRLKGDYLAIVTLAFGEIIKNLVSATLILERIPKDFILQQRTLWHLTWIQTEQLS